VIQIDVSRLKNSPGEELRLSGEYQLETVQGDGSRIYFNSPVRLDAVLVNDHGALRLSGSVEGKAGVACGRCLEIFDLPVTAELDEIYHNESQQEIQPGEEWIPFRGDRLDITPEVVKSIFSSMPMKLLCREDCRGLCPKCGANLNQESCDCRQDEPDPRLEVLKKLLEKDRH